MSTSSTSTSIGSVDDELVALLDEALAALPTGPSPVRARLLSSLAVELSAEPETRTTLGARARGARDGPHDARPRDARLRAHPELADARRHPAVAHGVQGGQRGSRGRRDRDRRHRALLDVHNYLMWIAAMVGDRPEVERRFEAYVRLADQMRTPATAASRVWQESALAEYDGRLADAERLTLEGLELARRADLSDSMISAAIGAKFYAIRMGQGRIDELVTALEGLVESQPGTTAWRVALAGALVESDRVEEARPHYMWLAADDCANVPNEPRVPRNRVRPRPLVVPHAAARAGRSLDLRPARALRRDLQLGRSDHHRPQRPRAGDGRRRARSPRRRRSPFRRHDRAL